MNKQTLKEMFNFTKNKKETIIIGIILILQLLIYTLSYPFIMQTVVDKAIPEGNMKLVMALSAILIIIVIVRFFTDTYVGIRRKNCCYSNNMEIKNKVFKSIQEAKVSEQDKMQEGNLFEIVGMQSYQAARIFAWSFVGLIGARLAPIVTISIILLILNLKLGFIVLSIFVLSYVILTPFYYRTIKIYKNLQKIVIDLQGDINEYIESYGTTKTLKLEEINLLQINEKLNRCKKEIIKSNKIVAIHNELFSILTFGSIITILIIGGNELSLGIGMASTIMLMVDYVDDINRHMKHVLEHVHDLNNRYNCFLNVLKISKMPKEKNEGTKSLENVEKIEFKDVSLSYDGVNTILDKINFTVEKPMQIAIVGKSGTGKTSLVNLLPRFYDICNGSILINDIDYREYKLEELRDNIAYVFQEPVIFENLLSYGEKQLLSFARAILKDADLIILDEVTSNLDLEFEEYIMNATKEILGGKISFVIAHRLNTIKNSDLILFLEDKQIAEAGTHEELMERKGKYYQLYSSKEEIIAK